MKIIAFGGSSSKASINKQLAKYATQFVENAEVELLDLKEYLSVPLYCIDRENADGIPAEVKSFVEKLQTADRFIISAAEHNQSISAFFKNLLDWCSRHELKFFQGKQILLLSTSPGGYGAKNARDYMVKMLPFYAGVVQDTFSLPFFYQKFTEGAINDEELKSELAQKVKAFVAFEEPKVETAQ
jgi:NAD(P)H-dependent FMN reductase